MEFRTFTPSVDSRVIYVSTSGSDANDGLSTGTPKLTIAAGVALMRDGFPDWLLLKCGDTWTAEPFSTNWLLSGRSTTEMMLLGTYGSGNRPILRLTNQSGFRRQGGGAAPVTVSHIAIVGIRFEEFNKTPSDTTAMISMLKQMVDVWVEDCDCYGGGGGALPQGESFALSHDTIVFNRCMFREADTTSASHTQGFYSKWTNNLTISECFFDHNGFTSPDIFKHNVYLDAATGPVIFEGNINMRSCCNGAQLRAGGRAKWNIFSNCPIALLMAYGDGTVVGQGVNDCQFNVIIQGTDVVAGTLRGWGIDMLAWVSGVCKYNIIGNKISTNPAQAISLSGNPGGPFMQNTEIAFNTITNWYEGILVDENNGAWTYTNCSIHDNFIEERRVGATAPLQYRLRFGTWAGLTYSNNIYVGTTTTPHSQGGSSKTQAQWVSLSGETGSNYTQVAVEPPFGRSCPPSLDRDQCHQGHRVYHHRRGRGSLRSPSARSVGSDNQRASALPLV
jgi:hypothetical protein